MKISGNLAADRVDVLLRTIETREMRVYAAEVGRAIEDRPGWIRLTVEQRGDRPGVDRNYHPAIGPKYSPQISASTQGVAWPPKTIHDVKGDNR